MSRRAEAWMLMRFTPFTASYELAEGEDGLRRFTSDYAFSSPSAAAAVVAGRSANGRTSWKHEASGLTYGDWQDKQVSAAADE